jgi:DNA-directed RNA polymerase specialized sigma24 family protein
VGTNLSNSRAGSQRFPETQWSLVGRAAASGEDERREALSILLQRYLPALRAHLIGARQIPADLAEDLVQGFIADKVIEQNLLDLARREKGKFRSFLRVTLNHYVISQHRADAAMIRSPAGGVGSLPAQADQLVGGADEDPANQYNLAWARELLAEAVRRMKAHCEGSKRGDVWTVFEGRVLRPTLEGVEPLAYEELVRELNLATPLDACNLLTTAKRMFAKHLRAVAGEYADPDQGPDAELDDLRQILSRAGGAAESHRALRT